MTTFRSLVKNRSALPTSFALICASVANVSCRNDKSERRHEAASTHPSHAQDSLTDADYVGSEACKSCHETAYEEWKGSHHNRSMMRANEGSVLADFNTTFTSQGITSKFYKKGGKFFVNTEEADGSYGDFEVVYTFGIEPLQQYIVEFPRGKFQCLRTAWDTEKKLWFDLYPRMQVVHDEWIHWTQGGLNWNTMCSDCHSTLVKKNYDSAKDSYNTSFSMINVSCEACHGPGKEHVRIAESDEFKSNPDALKRYSGQLFMGSNTMPKQMVDECARCHSLRTQYTEFYDHKGTYMDHYAPALLRDGMYFSDGQILEEVYVYGSFIQSKMYAQDVTCSDCHNVHSLELKLQGNELCRQCHDPQKYDVETHHFHELESDGAECIRCHMPGRIYMGNDFRRDHSFRVPRPDLSARYGVPNTCTDSGCHEDQTPKWAATHVADWYGPERAPHFSDALAFGRTRDPGSIPGLVSLAIDRTQPAIARSTALMYLAETEDPQANQVIASMLNDADPLLRYTSARSLDRLPPLDKAQLLPRLLVDEVRTVRIATLGSLVGVPKDLMSNLAQANFDNVFKEYWKALQLRSDFPGGQIEIAQYYEKTGNPSLAEQAYLRAIEQDSFNNSARMNLASLYYGQNKYKEAEKLFLKVIELEPDFGHVYYSLGLLYAEQERMLEAVQYLKEATGRIDDNDRVAYNYGLALQKLGKPEEAERAFDQGLRINPRSTFNLYALGYLYLDQKRLREASLVLKRLTAIEPTNQKLLRFHNRVQQALGQN